MCEKSLFEQKIITLNQQNCQDVTALINDFLSQKPQEITRAKDLAEKVVELTKSKSEMVYEALPSDDPQQRKPDTTKASEILGWSAKIDLEAGLVRTIADFKPRVLAL